MATRKIYKRQFSENNAMVISNTQKICVSIIELYNYLKKMEIKDRNKMTRQLKCMLQDMLTIDSKICKELNIDSIVQYTRNIR